MIIPWWTLFTNSLTLQQPSDHSILHFLRISTSRRGAQRSIHGIPESSSSQNYAARSSLAQIESITASCYKSDEILDLHHHSSHIRTCQHVSTNLLPNNTDPLRHWAPPKINRRPQGSWTTKTNGNGVPSSHSDSGRADYENQGVGCRQRGG